MFTIEKLGDTVIRIMPTQPLFTPVKYHSGQTVCQKPCSLCEEYRDTWRLVEETQDYNTKTALMVEARKLKPIERYFYNVISEGEVKLFPVGKTLHEKIVRGICEAVPPKLGWFERFWRWLFRKPKTWSALDWESGYNFVIKKNMKGGYPDYSNSGFIKTNTPAGTKEQIKEWKQRKPLTPNEK